MRPIFVTTLAVIVLASVLLTLSLTAQQSKEPPLVANVSAQGDIITVMDFKLRFRFSPQPGINFPADKYPTLTSIPFVTGQRISLHNFAEVTLEYQNSRWLVTAIALNGQQVEGRLDTPRQSRLTLIGKTELGDYDYKAASRGKVKIVFHHDSLMVCPENPKHIYSKIVRPDWKYCPIDGSLLQPLEENFGR